jgi:hypothetical protein
MMSRPVAGDEVVFVETNHPADRIVDVAWSLNGAPIPNRATADVSTSGRSASPRALTGWPRRSPTRQTRAVSPTVSRDVTLAGNTFNGAVVLSRNTQVSANERDTRLAGPYGPLLVGNHVNGAVLCSGNSAPAKDFGAPNTVRGVKAGDCVQL